ncbi:hypothetical protein [Sulfuracidifex tepidarius]|uniref:Uncharacterized protein n=1 Tax=Sulfuracidifex tepidarius TaxID=1294262 RepID=A0A510DU61_9CREN|nr:hypothetical protein [Sulfuracidifex tepidarius]BBG23600.1 hypothetical protein IC006_0888 [Sulfuracidifex tepidarius]BBG26347.1 hypothetical protein IC007_0855 [Sulfuracidifex tepidarius]
MKIVVTVSICVLIIDMIKVLLPEEIQVIVSIILLTSALIICASALLSFKSKSKSMKEV